MITVKGLDFIDAQHVRVRCFQLISDDTGKAVAVADFDDDTLKRFRYIDEIEYLMPYWKDQLRKHLQQPLSEKTYIFPDDTEALPV